MTTSAQSNDDIDSTASPWHLPQSYVTPLTLTASNGDDPLTLQGAGYVDAFRLWLSPLLFPRQLGHENDNLILQDFQLRTAAGRDLASPAVREFTWGNLFDMSNLETDVEAMNFVLTLKFVEPLIDAVPLKPDPNSPTYTYEFEFSLPITPTQSLLREPMTIETNGFAVTIGNLRVTPTFVAYDFCYDEPDEQYGWRLNAYVTADSLSLDDPFVVASVAQPGWRILPDGTPGIAAAYTTFSNPPLRSEITGGRCSSAAVLMPVRPATTELQIIAERLVRPLEPGQINEDTIASDEAFVAEQGIDVTIRRNGQTREPTGKDLIYTLSAGWVSIDVYDAPDAMLTTEYLLIGDYVLDNILKERVEGPWVFTVPIEPVAPVSGS